MSLKKTLTQPINVGNLAVWHVLALSGILWIGPMFIPDVIAKYAIPVALLWVLAYFVSNVLIKRAMRATSVDFILIERFYILITIAAPSIAGTLHLVRHGINMTVLFAVIIGWLLTLALAIGIAMHVANADKYYHGVRKDSFLK